MEAFGPVRTLGVRHHAFSPLGLGQQCTLAVLGPWLGLGLGIVFSIPTGCPLAGQREGPYRILPTHMNKLPSRCLFVTDGGSESLGRETRQEWRDPPSEGAW